MKVNKEHFDSIAELLAILGERPNNEAMRGERSSQTSDREFTDTKNYEEAIELITKGWDKPLEEIKSSTTKNIKTNVTRQKALPSTGIVGYVPCVPNALLGVPNSMIKTDRTPSKVKAITLTYGISVNCGWSAKEITKCGITALNIVNDLELEGYRVGLNIEFMCAKSSSDKELSIATVKIKDWRQPMDIKKMAFPLVHPSMFRRFGFKWLETCPQVTDRSYSSGYGRPLSNDSYESQLKIYNENGVLGANEYLITCAMCKDESYDKQRIMNRAGIKLSKRVAG